MDSTDLDALARRARRGYELSRVRQAALGVAPLLLVVPVAACMTTRPVAAWAFGAVALLLAAAMLWFGREPQRAVLPGALAGLVPLSLALCTSQMHYCGPSGCTSLCVPACTLGGVLAGLLVARVGRRRQAALGYWLSASALALLVGAMGCSCIGYSGILGLGAGFAASALPAFIRRRLRSPS